jgi:hypothetical protein
MRFMLIPAVLAAIVVTALSWPTDVSQAQVPTRYYGTVTVDGAPQSGLVPIVAEINDKNCSNPVAGVTFTNGYIIDVAADGNISGCGGVGQPYIFFKLGNRYATQIGCFTVGTFVELNLTISGPSTRPVPAAGLCGVTASPSPSPTPDASPTPTPSPPSAGAFSLSVLNVGSPCVPATGSSQCDATRQALWTGDQAAWAARFQMTGRPAPTPDQVFDATLSFRVEAGDPGAIAAIAQVLGWPHVRINATRFRGVAANELDEWVELRNMGGGSQDMTGWSVRVEGTDIRWTFQDGFTLQPGQSCKFYTGAPMAEPCPGSSNVAASGVLPNSSGTITLWVDWLDLLAIRASYNADPATQPPPPNLQGFN